MKNYLKLFLILVFFAYAFNTVQAEEVPKNIAQAHDAVWQVMGFDADGRELSFGTAFAFGKNIFATNFSCYRHCKSIF